MTQAGALAERLRSAQSRRDGQRKRIESRSVSAPWRPSFFLLFNADPPSEANLIDRSSEVQPNRHTDIADAEDTTSAMLELLCARHREERNEARIRRVSSDWNATTSALAAAVRPSELLGDDLPTSTKSSVISGQHMSHLEIL